MARDGFVARGEGFVAQPRIEDAIDGERRGRGSGKSGTGSGLGLGRIGFNGQCQDPVPTLDLEQARLLGVGQNLLDLGIVAHLHALDQLHADLGQRSPQQESFRREFQRLRHDSGEDILHWDLRRGRRSRERGEVFGGHGQARHRAAVAGHRVAGRPELGLGPAGVALREGRDGSRHGKSENSRWRMIFRPSSPCREKSWR